MLTCTGGVGRFEESHDSLGVQTGRAQEHGFSARVPPAHHGEAALSVAARDAVECGIGDALRYDQQTWITDTHTQT